MNKRHHLLLCLGTGPLKDKKGKDITAGEMLRSHEYRLTKYAVPGAVPVETPFVGEALLRLYPGTFTHVHLFGTADSMWDTLYLHLTKAGDPETPEGACYLELAEAVHSRRLDPAGPHLRALAQAFGAPFGVEVHVHVLPLPQDEASTWEMLTCMADLHDLRDGDALSLDVTHGLRVQPLFLLLAARYLQAAREGIGLRHVFYGAYDLQKDGVAPIQDLRTHIALLDWVDAARAFDRYGDAGPVAHLLGDGRAAQLASFAQKLQLNTAADIRTAAGEVLRHYKAVPDDAPLPFRLLVDRVLDLPRQIEATERSWQGRMLIAERHAAAQNLGLAVLAAWEAVLDRVAEAYELTPEERHRREVAGALTAIATGKPPEVRPVFNELPRLSTRVRMGAWKDWRGPSRVEVPFGLVVDTLQDIRNGIAHTSEQINGKAFKPGDVYRLAYGDSGESLFGYLRKVMEHPGFDDVSQAFPDWKKAIRS